MIYFFDKQGACIQVDHSSYDLQKPERVELLKLHCEHLPAAVNYVVTDRQYRPLDIYYKDGGIYDRPANPTKLEGLILRNLPIPGELVVGATRYPIEDHEIQLDLPLPGKYQVTVVAWPYKDKSYELVVG